MSTATKKAAKRERVLRKATFTKEVRKNTTVYHPVNKRARKWARTQGKRTVLTRDDLKAIIATKKVKVALYTPAGKLVQVR